VDLELSGRRAIVTGGGSNIGRGIVRALAAEGCRLAVIDIDADACRRVAEAAQADFDVECRPWVSDVTDRSALAATTQSIIDEWHGVDVLVHAAGGPLGNGTFFERSPEDQERDIRLNLFGAMNVSWAVVPTMIAARSGRAVLIASDTARQPSLHLPAYSIAKAGVSSLIRLLAAECGPSNVVVNGVNPMFTVPTEGEPVGERSRWNTTGKDFYTDERRAQIVSKIPLGRAGKPSEIADAVCFLASERAAFVNGQILSVNGGGIV
jgi:2-hydroxycyclohexanecarboxyl-CoA dehydrogenase